MRFRLFVTALLCLGATASAEDEAQRRAREELERQLNQMVGKQPAKVRIDFEALDEPNYKLEDVSFELDGRTLPRPALETLATEGTHAIWNGDVTPGKHIVGARVVYSSQASVVVSDEGGYTWKVSGTTAFDVHAGIEVRVRVTPLRDNAQKEISRRFLVRLPATPVMLAKVDDGKMPDPLVKKVELADAGPTPEQLAAAEKQAQAAAALEAKRLADEEKKRKAEEAAEAKRLAAEEKKRKAEEAREAKRLAAEERKRKAEEAKEALRLAAEEKKRKADEAKRLAAEGKLPPPSEPVASAEVDAGRPEEDAGVAEAAVEDAGAPLVAEAADAGVSGGLDESPAEEAGPPLLPIVLGAGVALLVLIIVIARRRSQPPKLDD